MKRGAGEVFASNPPSQSLYNNNNNIRDLYTTRSKRMKSSDGGREGKGITDYSVPVAIPDLLASISSGKYGSVTKDIEALVARKAQMLNLLTTTYPDLECKSPGGEVLDLVGKQVVDLENVKATTSVPSTDAVVIIDSDDEDNGDRKDFYHLQEIAIPRPPVGLLPENLVVGNHMGANAFKEEEDKVDKAKDKGIYLGVEGESDEENDESTPEDDGLGDLWKEMNMALEYSKDITDDQSSDDRAIEDDEDCDHSYVLKDDIGYVCRVCGVIQRAIETIFDFQYVKAARTRSYRSESRSSQEKDNNGFDMDGLKIPGHDLVVTEISPHPRHKKQMKPHQLEGFNFLLSNLITEHPGGCILAHAPGSGKTFMIISFMQSFLAKYEDARPLVVLPKGILSTWKKEFQRWQVEDIPLLDFYSMKSDSKTDVRTQQLEVLKKWVACRSILFLGYQQFASIVSGDSTNETTAHCQGILLKCPTILILDEGHTPRNEETDVLHSLSKVQTPRKVVLSGTLYQNHVKEVFTILNLVRPKFLKQETPKSIKKRIMSRVQFSGFKKQLKGNGESNFYELVEHTLQQDDDSKRKEAVIKDLREMTSKVLHYYKGDFLEDLPGLVDFTVLLGLSPKQKSELDKVKKMTRGKFKRSSDGSKVYTHPVLNQWSDTGNTALPSDEMIDRVLENIEMRDGVKAKFFFNMLCLCESAEEKLLVFSQYRLPLKFLERLAVYKKGWSVGKEIFSISGDSSTEQRELSMDRFNNSPDARVFFGSIKACGEGISLVGASRIIIMDVHLNPSVSRQAIGRAFRPGQKKKVYTYRLVAADSFEEEDHLTCFKKEQIAKRWFEWDEYSGNRDFEMEPVDLKDSDDLFLESRVVAEDVKTLYRR